MTDRHDRDLKPSDGERDPSLEHLLDNLIERLQAGEEVDLEAVIREHPGHAEPIRRLVPALEALVDFGESSAASNGRHPAEAREAGPPARVLGDFRLLQELGRGGMGIVYEAEQVSLQRFTLVLRTVRHARTSCGCPGASRSAAPRPRPPRAPPWSSPRLDADLA